MIALNGSLCKKTLQVHVTRRCNLECLHCYSRSSPRVNEELDVERICRALEYFASIGTEVVSFSGGEPLVYESLDKLLETSRCHGMKTTVITNGSLIGTTRYRKVASLIDAIAISIDGNESQHNFLRGSALSFQKIIGAMEILRKQEKLFGLVHTVTKQTLPDLNWLVEFALEHGASLLQLHPLENNGAAIGNDLSGKFLSPSDCSRLYLLANLLQSEYENRLEIQVDLHNRYSVMENSHLVYAASNPDQGLCEVTDLINPIVILSNGDIKPICYDVSDAYNMGNIMDLNLEAQINKFKRGKWRELHELCTRIHATKITAYDHPYFNWYEMLGHESRKTVCNRLEA